MFSKFNFQFSKQNSPGFTVLEIIIVIIILSILAASIGYKISSMKSDTSGIVAVDQVIADIQYVQMKAMAVAEESIPASKRNIVFTGTNTYTVAGENKTLPTGTTASPALTITFNSLGEPDLASDQVITVGGKQIKIYAITGKAEVIG